MCVEAWTQMRTMVLLNTTVSTTKSIE
uniref:Uncharacterized protein n=1 Tax=Rhizophora mucronata TaxID=61149 RepID=A0A2P2ILF0_RHIMU